MGTDPTKKYLIIITVFAYIGTLLFIYARFIEPNIILTKHTDIDVGFSATIVVISDLHLGVYNNHSFLERIVKQINTLEGVDMVLIPGDFTYYPPSDLDTLFSSLKEIKYPTYAVLGNHDSERPGPKIQKELQAALEKNGVIFLHNTNALFERSNIHILGLGDKWADEDDIAQIDNFKAADNLIVLTHNPDTIMNYTNDIPDVTIAGHTHGGQIRIPFVYKHVIPSRYEFDEGLYHTKNGTVYVSAGLGVIGLPMRFMIPPRIDVLHLN